MVRLWRLAFPGMGSGYLPEAGGVMDQAAAMMDAFAIMNAARAEIGEPDDDQDQHQGGAGGRGR